MISDGHWAIFEKAVMDKGRIVKIQRVCARAGRVLESDSSSEESTDEEVQGLSPVEISSLPTFEMEPESPKAVAKEECTICMMPQH